MKVLSLPAFKLSLCLIKQPPCHEDVWGSAGTAPLLTSALDEGEWSASYPGGFTPGEKAPGTIWIGVWDPEPVWTLWREKILATAGNRNPAVQPITWLIYLGFPVQVKWWIRVMRMKTNIDPNFFLLSWEQKVFSCAVESASLTTKEIVSFCLYFSMEKILKFSFVKVWINRDIVLTDKSIRRS
jgi:hypothetical protein